MKKVTKIIAALVLSSLIASSFTSCGVKKGCGCPSNINGAYRSAR